MNLAVAHFFQLCVVAAFGAVCGSFLNVVIYRLPRGLSVVRPRWSFCPQCGLRINWYDNIPVLGWLRLGARCRKCRFVIPPIYPLVETLGALIFLTVWDVVVRSEQAMGFGGYGPMLVAHLALYSGLLACSAMDIESYTVDVRIPIATIAIACLCHVGRSAAGLQVPSDGPGAVLAGSTADLQTAAHAFLSPFIYLVALAAGGVWLATLLFCLALRRPLPGGDAAASNELDDAHGTDAHAAPELSNSAARFSPGSVLILSGVVAGFIVWQSGWPQSPPDWRVSMPLLRMASAAGIFMTILILASGVSRPSDCEVVEEIEAGRGAARGLATREFALLLPALIAGLALALCLRQRGYLAAGWDFVQHESWFSSVIGRLALGLGLGAGSAVLGAGLGWAVRLLGTWGFGKEALGTGDIYILAAIAAAAGFWNAFYGFFLASLLALVGVVATAFRKRTRAIPFGPWLALGSFVALALEPSLNRFFAPMRSLIWSLAGGPING